MLQLACLSFLLVIADPKPNPSADDVAAQIKQLADSKDKACHLDAIYRLCRARKNEDSVRSIPALSKAAEDDDPEVRDAAISAAALIANTQKQLCPDIVVKALFDKNGDVRGTAYTYLDIPGYSGYSKEALVLLLRAMEHQDAGVRSNVVGVLVRAGGQRKEVLSALEKAANDTDWLVRNNAFAALWGISKDWDRHTRHLLMNLEWASDLSPALVKLLADPTPAVRRAAARNLAAITIDNLKAKKVVKELKADAALKKLLDDPDESVRSEAEAALKKLAE